MTNENLLIQCKLGLNIPVTSEAFDGVLNQKVFISKGYMKGAGVTDVTLDTDYAAGVIVLGACDLWNIQSGETKFSPVFHTLVTQLAISSLPPEE